VWGVGFAITGFGLFQIIVAKVLLSMLVVFLPVLLIFCFFEMFQGLLDRWVGFVIGVFFLQVLINIVLAFDLTLSDWWVASFQLTSIAHLSNLSAIPILILGIISIGLMSKVSTLAYSIGSGVGTLSGSSGGGNFIRRGLWGRHRSNKVKMPSQSDSQSSYSEAALERVEKRLEKSSPSSSSSSSSSRWRGLHGSN
jgi:hypothetical protein